MKPFTLPDGRGGLIIGPIHSDAIVLLYKRIDKDHAFVSARIKGSKEVVWKIPLGFDFLSDTSTMSEEVAGTLVGEYECPNQWCEDGYIDQGYNEYLRCQYCQEHEDSEQPYKDHLNRSLGLDPANRYIILVKG